MPPPARRLRAPLLWLLLPFMVGISLAAFPVLEPLKQPAGILAAAMASTVLAGRLAGQPGRRAQLGWALGLILAMILAGFIYPGLRYPYWRETSDRPPREVTVTMRVDQIYPGAATRRTYTGLGTITATGATDTHLLDRRVYFSATRKISVPPERAGCYPIRGVIEALPRKPVPLSFDDYLANLGIRQKITRGRILQETSPPGLLPRFSQRVAAHLTSILCLGLDDHPTVGALYVAMLLGGRAELSSEQQAVFLRSGTYHIFSISGLHVGVIAAAIYNVFSLLRISRRTTVLLTLPILWGYVQITGANYPALRAFIMIAFFLGAQVARQPMNGLASLALAAFATLLYDPLQLYSSGFQMSYSIVLALIVMGAPLAQHWLDRWRPFSNRPRVNWNQIHHGVAWAGRTVINTTAICWTAFLASIPASIGYFQILSPGSFVANLVIVPLASLAIISGFISLLAGAGGAAALSFLFNRAAAVVILGMNALLAHAISLPGVYLPAHFPSAWLAPAAIAIMSGVLLLGHAGGWDRRYGGFWPPAIAAALIALAAMLSG